MSTIFGSTKIPEKEVTIIVTGKNASGKTTIIREIANILAEKGFQVEVEKAEGILPSQFQHDIALNQITTVNLMEIPLYESIDNTEYVFGKGSLARMIDSCLTYIKLRNRKQ